MFVKPTSLIVNVPDPAHQGTPDYWLPPRGRAVEDSMYWRRRILDGDVVEVLAPAAETVPVSAEIAAPKPQAA